MICGEDTLHAGKGADRGVILCAFLDSTGYAQLEFGYAASRVSLIRHAGLAEW